MTPDARNWLIRWTLQGRPVRLPWDVFCSMPEEIFDYLPEPAEVSGFRLGPAIMTGTYPRIFVEQMPSGSYRLETFGFSTVFGRSADSDINEFCSTLEEAKRKAWDLVRGAEVAR